MAEWPRAANASGEVVDLSLASDEYGRNRSLATFGRLGVVVMVVGRVRGGEQADGPPAARTCVLAELLDRDLGGDGQVDQLREVRRLTVECVDDRGASRAGVVQGAGLAREEHEAVEDEGVLAILEQLRKGEPSVSHRPLRLIPRSRSRWVPRRPAGRLRRCAATASVRRRRSISASSSSLRASRSSSVSPGKRTVCSGSVIRCLLVW